MEKENAKFKKGNEWWRQRSKHGRDQLFSDPNVLLEECFKYFEMTDERKLYKTDFKGKDVVKVEIPLDVPYTIKGLCLFLGIHDKLWSKWRNERGDLNDVIKQVDAIIYENKMNGAMAGIFNANIVSRDLGLMEKVDHTTQGEKINVISLGSGVKPPDEND